MSLDTGEELLASALGAGSSLAAAARAIDPFIVPYDQLARVEGWVVWLGHPPVPEGLSLLPAPDRLMWDDPATAAATAAAVAADYAARRGARGGQEMKMVLERESPLAIVVPDEVTPGLRLMTDELSRIGIPVIDRPSDLVAALTAVPSFSRRRTAHNADIGRPHDPALSFQQIIVAGRIGGSGQSSFVLHNEGEKDGVKVVGDFGERVGIEIGVYAKGLTAEDTEALERETAVIPSFLNGVSSRPTGDALEIGWRHDARPSAQEIGEVFRAWLKALYDVERVDVRIAFAPPRGRSALLTEMRARAQAIRQRRFAAIAGEQAAPGSSEYSSGIS